VQWVVVIIRPGSGSGVRMKCKLTWVVLEQSGRNSAVGGGDHQAGQRQWCENEM
jgi:hypothetical protein